MALTNCTISSQSFAKTGGSAIGSDNAQLIITPNTGYVVSASDFTDNTGSVTGITSISLSDSGTAGEIGNTVLVDVDLDDTYIMPSANTTLTIDIDGSAQEIEYTLAGTYDTVVSNATPSSETATAYSATGNYNQQVTVFTKTFTASSGYYFENAPTYKLIATNPERYNITYADTTDGSGNLTARAFTIKYTFSNESQSGDNIDFTASAVEIYVPNVEITAYSIIKTNIDAIGAVREMTIYGAEGAEFSLTVDNEDSTSIISFTNQAIPASGQYSFNITFPSVTDNDQYDFVLTGDLSSDFDTVNGQDSTFNIKQLLDVVIQFGLTHSSSDITISTNKSKTLPAELSLNETQADFDNNFTISTSTASRINIIDNTVTLSEFTNTNYISNGGTPIDVQSFTFSRVSNTEITGVFTADVEATGEQSVTSLLDLDTYLAINQAPVSSTVSVSVNKGASTSITLVATDSDNDAVDGVDTITYYVVSLPSNGTLYSDSGLTTAITAGSSITGSAVYYEHDDSNNLTDSFTYKANDGYQDSNTATVNIAVGVSAGDSINTSGGAGLYLIPVILGTGAGTFKAHLNAQSVPDRFQILFDTAGTSNDIADMEVVADSLYVGDSVSSSVPANGTTTGLDEYTYVGSGGDATGTGEPGAEWNKTGDANQSITVSDAVVTTDTGARTDGDPNGDSRDTPATGTQSGVQNLVYTSTSDTTGTSGLDYHDGNICLVYTKSATTAYRAYLKVFGPTSGTAWDLFQTEFIES